MIGERLLDLRKDAGLTQDELAAILRINKHSISSYEREKSEPPDAIKIEIAKYFNVSIDYLPPHFPPEARGSLSDYAEFLKQKYTKQK